MSITFKSFRCWLRFLIKRAAICKISLCFVRFIFKFPPYCYNYLLPETSLVVSPKGTYYFFSCCSLKFTTHLKQEAVFLWKMASWREKWWWRSPLKNALCKMALLSRLVCSSHRYRQASRESLVLQKIKTTCK